MRRVHEVQHPDGDEGEYARDGNYTCNVEELSEVNITVAATGALTHRRYLCVLAVGAAQQWPRNVPEILIACGAGPLQETLTPEIGSFIDSKEPVEPNIVLQHVIGIDLEA